MKKEKSTLRRLCRVIFVTTGISGNHQACEEASSPSANVTQNLYSPSSQSVCAQSRSQRSSTHQGSSPPTPCSPHSPSSHSSKSIFLSSTTGRTIIPCKLHQLPPPLRRPYSPAYPSPSSPPSHPPAPSSPPPPPALPPDPPSPRYPPSGPPPQALSHAESPNPRAPCARR